MIHTGSHRQHALAGAGLFALGAGAILCVRMYNSRIPSLAKKTPLSEGKASSLSTNSSQSRGDRAVVKPSADVPSKTPCDGCDCGLGEAPGPLEGTMNAYERHVIICSGNDLWPKMIEAEEASMAESLHNLCLGAGLLQTKKTVKEAAERGETPRTSRVKITACTEPSRGPPGTTDVIVYPEGLIYTLDVDDLGRLQTFVKVQLGEQKVAAELEPVHLPYQKMVLVCTHGSRDKRCGRAGPQVLEAMARDLQARGISGDQVALRGSSHFGGHKWAGVLIIYPKGDWYGLVNKKNTGEILDKCVLGTQVMRKNWRGNMSNPGEKAEQQSSGVGPEVKANANANANAIETSVQSPSEAAPKTKDRARRESFDGCRGEGA